MARAYYNEFDPRAAQGLRNLIQAGLIAPGDVDDRSIEDVRPSDLAGYTQCHFFAGIGVWSHALRRAGWPDSRPVWTASCPCQPFSTAGKGAGFADERHLIRECRPCVVFGEQVASSDGLDWLDLVQADLEAAGYAVGAADLCAAGVGAPHIRQRLYWVADSHQRGRAAFPVSRLHDHERDAEPCGIAGGLANSDEFAGRQGCAIDGGRGQGGDARARPGSGRGVVLGWSGPTAGFWRDADWLGCVDGKWRPVEPGTSPLAHGAPSRVVRLRAYGNAIVAPLAETFIRSYCDIRG